MLLLARPSAMHAFMPLCHHSGGQQLRLLEIGFDKGNSATLWKRVFPAGDIHFIENGTYYIIAAFARGPEGAHQWCDVGVPVTHQMSALIHVSINVVDPCSNDVPRWRRVVHGAGSERKKAGSNPSHRGPS